MFSSLVEPECGGHQVYLWKQWIQIKVTSNSVGFESYPRWPKLILDNFYEWPEIKQDTV